MENQKGPRLMVDAMTAGAFASPMVPLFAVTFAGS